MISSTTPLLALLAGPEGLGGHVLAVDAGVAGQDPQRGGVAGHLKVGVLEEVFASSVSHGRLVQADHGLDLLGNLVRTSWTSSSR